MKGSQRRRRLLALEGQEGGVWRSVLYGELHIKVICECMKIHSTYH